MNPTHQNGGFLTLLKKRNFLRLWLAQLISMTILNASSYALLILIGSTTNSTTLIGLAIICFSLPAVLFGAPAGVFVDHMNKRRVLWASNCLRAIATLLFVIVLLIDHTGLLPIYLLTFIIATIGQFFTPAESTAIPMLVNAEEMMPALSLFNVTFMLSQALGYVLFAPILLSFLPTFTIFHIQFNAIVQLYILIALLYLVCAGLILSIPSAHFKPSTASQQSEAPLATRTMDIFANIWQEMRQGWSFVRTRKPLFQAVIQLSFVGVLILVIGQLATPIVTQLLRLPTNAMALVFAPAGVGLVLGSVVMPRISRWLGRTRAVMAGSMLFATAALLIPLTTTLVRHLQPHGTDSSPLLTIAVACLMFVAGFALDFINIPASTTMQEMTPNWIKGRVFALQIVLYSAFSIPIILFIGVLADLIGIGSVLYVVAGSAFTFGLWNIYYEHKYPPIDEDEEPLRVPKKATPAGPSASSQTIA